MFCVTLYTHTFQHRHNMSTKPLYQKILRNSFSLYFNMLYGRYQYIFENYSVKCIDKNLQIQSLQGPGWFHDYNSNSYKPVTNAVWVRARLCNLRKRCTWLAAPSDKVDKLLAHGRWVSLGTPSSSTTENGCYDIAELLLKFALSTNNK